MWKAFDEMQCLGWIGAERPKMISVQASGCAPITKAWEQHKPVSESWQDARTIAAGLRVPKPYADYIILDILKASGGTAISVTDSEILQAVRECASAEANFCRAGRRRISDRVPEAGGFRVPERERSGGVVQHRVGPEVHRRVFAVHPKQWGSVLKSSSEGLRRK